MKIVSLGSLRDFLKVGPRYHDEGCAVAADILDLHEFVVRHHHTSWITRIGRQNDRSSTGNLFFNLCRVNVVVILSKLKISFKLRFRQ